MKTYIWLQINDFKVGLFHKACQEESDELYENVIFKCLHDTLVTRQIKIIIFQKTFKWLTKCWSIPKI